MTCARSTASVLQRSTWDRGRVTTPEARVEALRQARLRFELWGSRNPTVTRTETAPFICGRSGPPRCQKRQRMLKIMRTANPGTGASSQNMCP